jgi:hypothetical protein
MRFVFHSIVILTLALSTACSKTAEYQKRAGTLDSISGAINNVAAELRRIDTSSLQKQITKFEYYRAFLNRTLPDTIDKKTAEGLQRFLRAGNNIVSFSTNRQTLLARVALMNSQYARLSGDIKESTISLSQLDLYLAQEIIEASKVSEQGHNQVQSYFRSYEEFRLTVKEVEELIMRCNNGLLPTIINDTSAI